MIRQLGLLPVRQANAPTHFIQPCVKYMLVCKLVMKYTNVIYLLLMQNSIPAREG